MEKFLIIYLKILDLNQKFYILILKFLSHAIKQNKNIGEVLIHTHCFFHYSSMIKKNLGKSGIYKKRLNKLSVEIITNLEIL